MVPQPLLAPAEFVDAEFAEAREQSAACDRRWIAAVYAQHGASVHRFLCDLLGDSTAAADAMQETFARAFDRIDRLNRRERVAPWLFGIARNVSREVRKARRRSDRTIAAHDGHAQHDHEVRTTPEGELLSREAATLLQAAMARLPEDRRAAMLLRSDHGLSYEEIAVLMHWSLAKVKVEIFRAREQLRETLKNYEGGAR